VHVLLCINIQFQTVLAHILFIQTTFISSRTSASSYSIHSKTRSFPVGRVLAHILFIQNHVHF